MAVFGSQATGLFLPTSDIDLVILFKKKDDEVKSDEKEKSIEKQEMKDYTPMASPLKSLADALKDEWREELSYLEVIENARVPLVKFTHGPSGISFDVCFDQETGPKQQLS